MSQHIDNTIFITIMEHFGLREAHAQVYESLLALGQVSAGKLAKNSSIARASLYGYLDQLVEAGFVNQTELEGATLFSAVDPKILDKKLLGKQLELQQAQNNLSITLQSFQPQIHRSNNLAPKVLEIKTALTELIANENVSLVLGDKFPAEYIQYLDHSHVDMLTSSTHNAIHDLSQAVISLLPKKLSSPVTFALTDSKVAIFDCGQVAIFQNSTMHTFFLSHHRALQEQSVAI